MQRIFNIEKWTHVPQGKAIQFRGDRPRRIHLEVNAPAPVRLLLVNGTETRFLALVCGRDTVEFYATGNVAVAADGGDCFVYTVDGEVWTFADVDPESYTVVKERRERNYELELIAAKMAENMNRRMEQQAHEIQAAMERRLTARSNQLAAESVAARAREQSVDAGVPREPKQGGKRRDRGSGGEPASDREE